jgi:Fic family protein
VSAIPIEDYIHQSNLIEGYDDAMADEYSAAVWRWLIRQPKLSEAVICTVQQRITSFQHDLKKEWRGQYRKIPVWVGGREVIMPSRINEAMDNWIIRSTGYDPIEGHIIFEKIHPFVDGNGRTGRMLMWWQQRQRGEPLKYIPFNDRQSYYKWFSTDTKKAA